MTNGAMLLPHAVDEELSSAALVVRFRLLVPFFLVVLSAWLLSGCTTTSFNQITFSNAANWRARLALLQTGGGTALDAASLSTRLRAGGLQANMGQSLDTPPGKVQILDLAGSGGFEQVRSLIFGELSPAFNPLGGQTALTLQGAVHAGQAITFVFETNATTGYGWQAESYDPTWIQQVGEPVYNAGGNGIGVPAKQIFRFSALRDGSGSIRWVYRRPWEVEEIATERSLTIQAPELETISDLSNPHGVSSPFSLPVTQDVPAVGIQPLASLTLPVRFDWRANTSLPAVRNQGGCGSCWAFATVGVLESAMAIRFGAAPDLSEQYLVSCNSYGWGCGGGFSAHEFHQDTLGLDASSPGAVLESSFPYADSDGSAVACKGPLQHPVQISSWSYLYNQDKNSSLPIYRAADDQIKQAIFLNGPVETMVCAGTGWGAYRGGVFSKDETAACGGSVNHAVDLVGWDDAMKDVRGIPQKVWILRNSWGSGWGDHGYMYLLRGTSNIGAYTSYVKYDGSRDLVSPSNSCQATKILACGTQVRGQNNQAGSNNLQSSYACSERDESGPEVTYQLSPTISGRVTARLIVDPLDPSKPTSRPDLDVFALNAPGGDCTAKTCAAFGEDTVTFDARAGQPVYLNVDGHDGAVGSYTLSISCDQTSQDAVSPQNPIDRRFPVFMPIVAR